MKLPTLIKIVFAISGKRRRKQLFPALICSGFVCWVLLSES